MNEEEKERGIIRNLTLLFEVVITLTTILAISAMFKTNQVQIFVQSFTCYRGQAENSLA